MGDEHTTRKSQLLAVGHLLLALVSIAGLVFLNYLLISSWFRGEHAQNIASIEISYIQMAKFWSEGGGLWQPLWYLGYPWHVFYTPLLPTFELIWHNLSGASFAHAYRVLTGLGFVLTAGSLYLFVWQISKSKTGALVSALFYTFVPSVIGFFFEGVKQDTISGLGEPRRYTIMVRWGEGPHILGILYVPLFGFFLARFIETKRFTYQVLAGLFFALVALTNAVALWGAILLLIALFLGEIAKKNSEFIATLKTFATTVAISLGLIAFWYNFAFIGTFFREGGGAFANWYAMFPWGMIVLGAIGFLGFWVIRKFAGEFNGLAFSILWFLMLFGLVYAYYASGDSQIEYVPQVLRLNTEVDMALGVLLGVIVSNVFLRLTTIPYRSGIGPGAIRDRIKRLALVILGYLVFLLAGITIFVSGSKLLGALSPYTKPFAEGSLGDIKNTNEYRVSKKLEELVANSDQRVVAPGNYSFWLNYFVDIPQIRGALYQSSTHFWPDHIYYQLTNGSDANISLAWLKIANVGKLVFTGPGSGETYKDYKVDRQKFDSVLVERTGEFGDVFYDVPLKNDSIAKVVNSTGFEGIKRPYNAIDSEPIFRYLAFVEEKSDKKLAVQKISRSHLKISGELAEGEGILVQNTFDPGWTVNGKGGWKLERDPFDFMVLVPKPSFAKASDGKPVAFKVDLRYGKPLSVWLGYLITLATVGLILRKFHKTYVTNKTDKTYLKGAV